MSAPRLYRAPAKINWYLRVLGKRKDGYHDIDTVYQELDLCDDLAFEPAEEPGCCVAGLPADIDARDNLITRAHQLLRDECGATVHGVRVRVTKRIPAGGGLGGGSSNAAATLKAVNDLCGLGLGAGDLEALGARLGSDVPFFIRGGCAIGTGRGEHLTPVTAAGQNQLVLAIPHEPMPTAESYRLLDLSPPGTPPGGLQAVVQALETGDTYALARAIHNDFEVVAVRRPWFLPLLSAFAEAGALRGFLCGSGSTTAALMGPGLSLDSVMSRITALAGRVLFSWAG